MRIPKRAIVLATTLTGLAAFTLQISAQTLTGTDVGPAMSGAITTTNDAAGKPVHVVTGSGADIWGTADEFYYAYFKATGDFDYVVRVAEHIGNSGDGGWSKAELMAREHDGSGLPQPGDPFIANMATRPTGDTANGAPAGTNHRGPQWRSIRDLNASWTQPNPTYPPNAAGNNWLRMERVGSIIYMYTSDDGQTWNMYNPYNPQGWDTSGSWPPGTDNPGVAFFTNAWPNEILLGLAVTAHNAGDYSTVVFKDFGPYTPKPIAINTQPAATVSISQNTPLTLSVAATGDPVHYQWMKGNTPIPRAVGPTYSVPLAQLSDAGTYKVKVFGGGTETMSSESVVTVTVDTQAPTVQSFKVLSLTGIRVEFSEPVTDSALTVGNYQIDQGVTVSSITRVSPTTVQLNTSKMGEGLNYVLTINGIRDTANPANSLAANTKVNFISLVFEVGTVTYERWDNANGDPGNLAAFATAVANGTIRSPDVVLSRTQFGGPWGAADNYSSRVSGFFIPESNGDYVFFVSSDDASNLYLSTDESPANKKLIAHEDGWSNQYQWHAQNGTTISTDKRSDMYSASEWTTPNIITLQAGKRYYLEILHDEGGGGDGADATVIKSGEADPESSAAGMFLLGDVIGRYIDINGANVTFTEQPQSVTIAQNTTATLTAAATGTSAYGNTVAYQWQRAPKGSSTFADITGATTASYTTPLMTLADDGVQYRVVATVPGVSTTSSIATVSINADATPPTALSAGAFAGTPRVGVAFSELMDPVSAANSANYTVAGATVSSAALHFGKFVELTLAANVTTAPVVTISGVKDLAGNTVANTTLNGTLSDMTAQDLGFPAVAGSAFSWGNGYFIDAGGADLWGNADSGYMVYKQFTGPFDMRARVEGLINGDEWGKAALMARETIDGGSRNEAVLITKNGPYPTAEEPSPGPYKNGGVNVYNHQWRNATDGASESKAGGERISPTVFPSWLRLVRESTESNEMKSYISYDGQSWILYHTHATPEPLLPATLVLGMAATAHDDTLMAQAAFDSFSIRTFEPVFDPNLAITQQGDQLTITWESGTLVSSPSADGTYAPVANATSPYTVQATGSSMFFRVRQ